MSIYPIKVTVKTLVNSRDINMNLVKIEASAPTVSTANLWGVMGYKEHRTLKRVISDNKESFEEYGFLHLQVQKPNSKNGGRPYEAYLLNEDQFILLVVLAKNTKSNIDLKRRVVREFARVRRALQKALNQKGKANYDDARFTAKNLRSLETDTIKEFIKYAKEQGGSPKGCDRYYVNITTMVNRMLFIVAGKFTNLRDVLSPAQLMTVGAAAQIVDNSLRIDRENGVHYKAAYLNVKAKIETFAEIHGQSNVMALGLD